MHTHCGFSFQLGPYLHLSYISGPKLERSKAKVQEGLVPAPLGKPCWPAHAVDLVNRRAPLPCWFRGPDAAAAAYISECAISLEC